MKIFMARKDEISHLGEIIAIDPSFTTVKILVTSACQACHAKAMCGMADQQDKIIMVPTDPYAEYAVGDEVRVLTKKSMGLKAVWISYVIPLIILMILILSLSVLIGNELMRGLVAIGGVALYYGLIYIFREKLSNEFSFYIKEK